MAMNLSRLLSLFLLLRGGVQDNRCRRCRIQRLHALERYVNGSRSLEVLRRHPVGFRADYDGRSAEVDLAQRLSVVRGGSKERQVHGLERIQNAVDGASFYKRDAEEGACRCPEGFRVRR